MSKPTLESLIALVGQAVTAAKVQSLVLVDELIASTEPDLEEGEAPRNNDVLNLIQNVTGLPFSCINAGSFERDQFTGRSAG